MRLRHITKNVRDQNWLAVVLDFFIVVAGVFIGIQLGNWNDGRQAKKALLDAETRFAAENSANIEAVETFLDGIGLRLDATRHAIEALKNCKGNAQSEAAVITGVNAIRGTPGLKIRATSLKSITGNDDFLSLMKPENREHLKEFERILDQTQDTLDWLEDRPFEKHIEDQDHIRFGNPVALPNSDDLFIRPIQFSAPIETICQNRAFLDAFYLWERTGTFQTLRARQFKEQLNQNLTMFAGR